jgi:uncharacterized membrane protein
MKIFGHPLHIMLIHFPSALFPMDLVCSLAGYYKEDTSFVSASFYAICGGVVLGWLAVITGVIDLVGILKNKPGSIKKAIIHGSINTTVLTGYTLLGLMAFKKYPELVADGPGKLFIKAALVAILIIGNYIGGSLILKDKIAVEK